VEQLRSQLTEATGHLEQAQTKVADTRAELAGVTAVIVNAGGGRETPSSRLAWRPYAGWSSTLITLP